MQIIACPRIDSAVVIVRKPAESIG